MMTETEKLLHRVRAYLAQPGVSKAGLAVAAGLHKNALRDADRPEWNPTADTLQKVELLLPKEEDVAMGGSVTPGIAEVSPDNSTQNIGEADSRRPFSLTSFRTTPLDGAADPRPLPSSTGDSLEADAA